MSLKDQLRDDMKSALKAKDSKKLLTVRSIISEVRNVEIDYGEQNDEGVIKIIRTMIKQWDDAMKDYENAKRQDLVEETLEKLVILKSYLPKEMSDEELEKIIKTVMTNSKLTLPGPLTGAVMREVGGKVSGARVAQKVAALLK